MNPILEYFFDKQNGNSTKNFEENPFEAYPLDIVDRDGVYKEGFLQDATHEVTEKDGKELHTLDVIWIEKDTNIGFILHKNCTAPKGCKIRWDDVHCAFSFNKEDFENETITVVND